MTYFVALWKNYNALFFSKATTELFRFLVFANLGKRATVGRLYSRDGKGKRGEV
jgi:hypothetical protein